MGMIAVNRTTKWRRRCKYSDVDTAESAVFWKRSVKTSRVKKKGYTYKLDLAVGKGFLSEGRREVRTCRRKCVFFPFNNGNMSCF